MKQSVANRPLAVVVPVYDDDSALSRLSQDLTTVEAPVIVVDGLNRRDNSSTAKLCQAFGWDYVQSPASRGGQIVCGLQQANADWYWVLHADTQLTRPVVDFC